MINTLNTIEILSDQISSLLELIQCAKEDCVCVKSIKTASEMCLTMHNEIMIEVNKLYEKAKKEVENNESR